MSLAIVEQTTVPVYVPGRKVSCTESSATAEFNAGGWHRPEKSFTWIDGPEAHLHFIVRRPVQFYTLRCEVHPFTLAGTQPLEIFFNYFRVGYFEIKRRSVIDVKLPAELFILRISTLTLHCSNAQVGKTLGIDDNRRLGIAVVSWMLL